MKYISSSVVSGPFGKGLILANQLYAIPIELEEGTHVFDQAFMQFLYGNVRVAIYSDSNDYPDILLLDVGVSTSNTLFKDTENCFFDFTPSTLGGGKYWLVCISDRDVSSASYVGQQNSLLLSTIGVDISKNDSIVGYTIRFNYLDPFSFTFPINADSLIGTDTAPVILLRETSFVPVTGVSGFSGFSGSGGTGVSGESGFSGVSGSSAIGVSGFSGSGISGFSGNGLSGFSGESGFSGFSGSPWSMANMMAITSLRM